MNAGVTILSANRPRLRLFDLLPQPLALPFVSPPNMPLIAHLHLHTRDTLTITTIPNLTISFPLLPFPSVFATILLATIDAYGVDPGLSNLLPSIRFFLINNLPLLLVAASLRQVHRGIMGESVRRGLRFGRVEAGGGWHRHAAACSGSLCHFYVF